MSDPLINNVWKYRILSELVDDRRTCGYSDLLQKIGGITPEILTDNIIEMENDGVIIRHTVMENPPPAAYYELTEKGRALKQSTESMDPSEFEFEADPGERDICKRARIYREKFKEKAAQNNGKVKFYGLLYGKDFVHLKSGNKIYERETNMLCVRDDGSGFEYILAVPGPDVVSYDFADYGRSWAFSIDDFEIKLKYVYMKSNTGKEIDGFVVNNSADRSIPFCNTIMKCSDYGYREIHIPDYLGYSIVSYRPGYEKDWAELEYSLGDFDSAEEAEKYFTETYLQDPEQFSNILFMLNKDKDVVGSCIAWWDMKDGEKVPSVHWLVVNDLYQGAGCGKYLCTAVMNIFSEQSGSPVYVHTQPWSWKAILLYIRMGFKLQKTDTFSHYENEYDKAMAELKKVVTEEQYILMQQSSED